MKVSSSRSFDTARLDEWFDHTSMSGAGNCYDNAVAESFFSILKRERLYRQHYQTRAEARTDIFQYIEVFYNRQRRHSAVGHMSPERFETAKRKDEICLGLFPSLKQQ